MAEEYFMLAVKLKGGQRSHFKRFANTKKIQSHGTNYWLNNNSYYYSVSKAACHAAWEGTILFPTETNYLKAKVLQNILKEAHIKLLIENWTNMGKFQLKNQICSMKMQKLLYWPRELSEKVEIAMLLIPYDTNSQGRSWTFSPR